MATNGRQIGGALVLAATTALSLAGAGAGALPFIVFPKIDLAPAVQTTLCVVVAGAAALAIAPRLTKPAALLVVAFWIAGAGAAAVAALAPRSGLTAWVPVAEACLLAAAGALIVTPARAVTVALVAIAAATLALFGAVHLTGVEAIAGLIPRWIPGARILPFLTGAAMIAAAVLLPVPRLRRVAALAIALMFASWLPVVHAPRIAAAPSDGFEWQFALMAVALVGALVLTAHTVRPVPSSPGPHS